jgi:sugar transferase (PEP-CTERM/EpsH1 system associated)
MRMANVLYLVHRLPYPPNKGDKVRSYHLLKHLAARHRIFLGTFVDDPDDEAHIETVRGMCAELHVSRINPRVAKLRSLAGLLDGRPLSLAYYADRGMREWVARTVAANPIDVSVVFSSAMGQYVVEDAASPMSPMLVDFVDVDSAKWTQYAAKHRWPLSWVYGREGERLLAYERQLASRARKSFFVTESETNLFKRMAPECSGMVQAISNGVDAHFFSPNPERRTPFADGELPVVFTGAMDYWPNIDAVTWFVAEMLPSLRQLAPTVRFYIVGRSPTPAVQALASDGVVVTGTVPDVRPYLQFATVVVAPMRVARGLQNKILEAMSMGRPVVAAQDCVTAISAIDGRELMAATTAKDYVEAVQTLLGQPDAADRIGRAGRECVVKGFSWDAHLMAIDPYLTDASPRRSEYTENGADVAA